MSVQCELRLACVANYRLHVDLRQTAIRAHGANYGSLDRPARTALVAASRHSRLSAPFERLLADVSSRFVNLPEEQIDGAISDALRRSCEVLGADRAQLLLLPQGPGEQARVTHAWAAADVVRVVPKPIEADFPWVIQRWRAGQSTVLRTLADLPREAQIDRQSFERVGTRSHLGMPMLVAGRVERAIVFASLLRDHDWPEEVVERVGVLAMVFANALAHQMARDALHEAVNFERTVTQLLANLLASDIADRDQALESALRDMSAMFSADRAALWRRVRDTPEFVRSQVWNQAGQRPLPMAGEIRTPWIAQRLVEGAAVAFDRLDELPREAALDRRSLRQFGICSAMIVPVIGDGRVAGALSFARSRDGSAWPKALLLRVRLVGEVLAAFIARDVSERRARDAQAQSAHAARIGTVGVFAASLVHELTQPAAATLANAQTATDMLAAQAPNTGELRLVVADIARDAQRAADLIQQLRRFLRRGAAARTTIDVGATILEAVRLAESEARGKAVDVVVDVEEGLPPFIGDGVQIQQVLLNLLLNAVDALASAETPDRIVRVRAHRGKNGIRIEVQDNGRGMDEATQAQIFQPFFTTKPNGMGLGLSISRTIITAHGGSLDVESVPGRGTTFSISLPLLSQLAAPRKDAPAAPTQRRAGRVFVVDDDPSMRRAVQRQLLGAGHEVEVYSSASDFLARPAQVGNACMVCDVQMPGITGLELQAELIASGRELPIVFMTGHGDTATTARAMKAGAVNFLAKPFSKDALLAAVDEALAFSDRLGDAAGQRRELEARYARLTPREREVFALVCAGRMNKIIADQLGAAERTIKIHRGRVMDKMCARSVADLVRMSERLRLVSAAS